MVRHVRESLTDEQLATEVTRTEPGWPRVENFSFNGTACGTVAIMNS
jgi:hypothetical protein